MHLMNSIRRATCLPTVLSLHAIDLTYKSMYFLSANKLSPHTSLVRHGTGNILPVLIMVNNQFVLKTNFTSI